MKAYEIIKSIRYDGIKLTHLKTLSASVDEMDNPKTINLSDSDDFMIIILLNRLSKIKLTLSQFVPCGADGKPLEPFVSSCSIKKQGYCCEAMEPCECGALATQYDNAQKNVIFEGWEVVDSCNDDLDIIIRSGDLYIFFYVNINGVIVKFGAPNKKSFNIKTLADLAAATISNPIKFK